MSYELNIDSIPDGHVAVGYVATIKLLDENGKVYWAHRSAGLDDMELYGMVRSHADDVSRQLRLQKRDPE